MLFDRDKLTELLELGPGEIAEFCDGYLSVDTLSDHFAREEPFSRKELCQYLGIGESTMTGWLKEDRIPLMAKEAVLLPLVLRVLKEEIARLRKEAGSPRILQNGNSYQIVNFQPDEAGEAIGEVVADNIANLHNARLILAGVQALDLLGECDKTALDHTIDHFSDGEYPEYLERLESLRTEIRMCRSYAYNYENWRDWKNALVRIEHYKTKEGRQQAKEEFQQTMEKLSSSLVLNLKTTGDEKSDIENPGEQP